MRVFYRIKEKIHHDPAEEHRGAGGHEGREGTRSKKKNKKQKTKGKRKKRTPKGRVQAT